MRVSNINTPILSGMNNDVETHKSNIQGISDVSNSRSQALSYPQITRLGNYNKPMMNKPSFKGLEETAEEINKNNTYEKNLRLQTLSKKSVLQFQW